MPTASEKSGRDERIQPAKTLTAGSTIALERRAPSIGGIVISYENDERFDRCVDFAIKFRDAISESDLTRLPDGVSRDLAESIFAKTGEERERATSELFYSNIQNEFGQYDTETILLHDEIASLEADFAETLCELLDVPPSRLCEPDFQREIERILLEPTPELSTLLESFGEQRSNLFSQELELARSYDEDSDSIETTFSLGKGSGSERGLVCRHIAPVMAAMMSSLGEESYTLVTKNHMTVFSATGNIIEATADNASGVYRVVLKGNIDELDKPQFMLLTLTSSGELKPYVNHSPIRELTEEESRIIDQFRKVILSAEPERLFESELKSREPFDMRELESTITGTDSQISKPTPANFR